MKNKLKFLTVVSASLAIVVSAQAQPRRSRTNTTPAPAPRTYSFASNTLHEVVISPSQISIQSYKYSKSRTDINIYGAYNHHLMDNMQVGGEGGIISGTDSKGDSKALFAAMGVFTWNFDTNLREAFFVNGGLGLYPSYVKKDGDFESKISLFAGGGKRFEVWGKLNYMPYARIWKRGDENTSFEIQALNFSIFY
jgi:hypothetical protein